MEFHLRRHLALEIVISLVGCFDVSQSRVQLVVMFVVGLRGVADLVADEPFYFLYFSSSFTFE